MNSQTNDVTQTVKH